MKRWHRWSVAAITLAGISIGLYSSGIVPKAGTTGCFENPETEGYTRIAACGYPTPGNVGAEFSTGKTCGELPELTFATLHSEEKPKPKELIEGKNIVLGENTLTLENEGVTFNKDCISADTQTGTDAGNPAIFLTEGEKNFTITNSTLRGENQQTKSLGSSAIWTGEGSATGTVIKKDVFYWCVECIQGPAEASESYVLANAELGKGQESETLHREDWYVNESTIVAKDDTLLNPESNVANVFLDQFTHENTPCVDHLTLEGSLLAGGFATIEMCGSKVSAPGTSTLVAKKNRFARCTSKPLVPFYYEFGELGKGCTTAHSKERCITTNCSSFGEAGTLGSVYNASWDSHGYFPESGLGQVLSCEPHCPTGREWEGNIWDDDLNVVAE